MKGLRQSKLSLNVGKTKDSLFHKPNRKNDLPFLLPRLQIKNHKVEKVTSIKFLGALLNGISRNTDTDCILIHSF